MSRPVCLPVLLAAAVVAAGCGSPRAVVDVGSGARASRAPAEIADYGCGSCHTIAGISGARGQIGPKLSDFAGRRYIAGRLANTPPNLVAWIRDPQRIDPGNIMPTLGVTDAEAHDIAAYLYRH